MKRLAILAISGTLLFGSSTMAQKMSEASQKIRVSVLDGRNGKFLINQRALVFTGLTRDAVSTHAAHTVFTTNKDGTGTLIIYPSETKWLQVFIDGRVPCFPNPNKSSFSVDEVMSKGIVTPNGCGSLIKDPTPGHLTIFTRPAHFMEKMTR